ncbi:MAG: hypothetical protein K6U80_06335 [Firmicutes bacterium]|nr:hypothetical protein [Bacillota bacterium]
MKKLSVVLLALTFVVAMATAAFAVTTASVDGKVEWTLDNANQFGGSVDGKIVFDLAKDFGEGYSAGLKIKLEPNATDDCYYDGDGWIKMAKDFGTLTFQTGGVGGNAAKDLGVGYDMTSAAGVKFESTSLMEGLNLTVAVNDTFKTAPDPKDDGNYANYLLKGEYTADALTIGAGYQAHTQPTGVTNPADNDAMAVWAGYKLGDALSFGLEYASRPNVDGVDANLAPVTGSTAILVKAGYTADALTINGQVLMTTGSFWLIDPDDMGTTSAWNYFKYGNDRVAGVHVDPKDGTGVAGTALKVDATYKLTDALSVTATVEDIMEGAIIATTGAKLDAKQLLSYKLSADDQLTEALKLSGWYAGYGDLSEIGVKGEYTFAAGLVGSLEAKSNSTVGSEAVNSYTAKITATL